MRRSSNDLVRFICLTIIAACLAPAPFVFGQAPGLGPILIFSLRGEQAAADHLKAVLKSVAGRDSQVRVIQAAPDSFEAIRSATSALLEQRQPSVAIVPWSRGMLIPSTFHSIPPRIVTLGPTKAVRIHLVSRQRSSGPSPLPKIVISTRSDDRATLQKKVFGWGPNGSPTKDDALNLFMAIDAYPCPVNSSCEDRSFNDQVTLFLREKMHAYFLTGHCPHDKVESTQDILKDNFYLVPIPHDVVKRMADRSDKPYVFEYFDPQECRYPVMQGKIDAAGVSGAVVASPGLDKQSAVAIATALIKAPPFPTDAYSSVVPKLASMFPFHKDTLSLWSQWLRK